MADAMAYALCSPADCWPNATAFRLPTPLRVQAGSRCGHDLRQLCTERLQNVARALGDPRRVMAGTDCGFDTAAGMGRVTSDVVWAKLKALSDGAALASKTLL